MKDRARCLFFALPAPLTPAVVTAFVENTMVESTPLGLAVV